MTQQITLVKDKILSDNYFTLHNIIRSHAQRWRSYPP